MESFVGQMRNLMQQTMGGVITCKVYKTNPLQLKVCDASDAIIPKESLIVPSMSLAKNNTVYIQKSGDSYMIVGKGK